MENKERLEKEGYLIVTPLYTQIIMFLLCMLLSFIVILMFGRGVLEYVLIIGTGIFLFFISRSKKTIPINSVGVIMIAGTPFEKYLLGPGRPSELPGRGNKVVHVSITPQTVEFKAVITTQDDWALSSKGTLRYQVYNILKFIEVGQEEGIKKSLDSLIEQAFFGIGKKKEVKDFLGVGSDDLAQSIKEKIEGIPGKGFKLEDFGIEIIEDYIAAKPFEFADPKSRELYEAKAKEKKQGEAEKEENDNFIARANDIVEASKDSDPENIMSFESAYDYVHRNSGKNPTGRNINELKVDGNIIQPLANALIEILKNAKS